MAWRFVPVPRQRVDRARRQPRRHPLGPVDRRPGALDQLRARAGQGHPRPRPGHHRARGGGSIRVAAAPCREPALRPPRRRQADLLGGGLRRDHRLRLAHGRDVRQPAVPPERARLQHRRGRRRLPARDLPDGPRRPALGRAGRDARRPDDPATGLRVPLPRLPVDAAVLGGGQQLLEDRPRLRLHRHRRGTRGHSRLPLADGISARAAGRHGLGHGGPATRPRRCDHAVRSSARCSPRATPAPSPRRSAAPRRRPRSPPRWSPSSRSRSPVPSRWRSSTPSTPTRSPPRPSRPSCRATTGPTAQEWSRSCWAPCSSSCSSHARRPNSSCCGSTPPQDAPTDGT